MSEPDAGTTRASDGVPSSGAARLRARQETWHRLEGLLARVEGAGLHALSHDELREFGRLHRRCTSHLAQARAGRRDKALIAYLNQLVLRSHNTIYRTPSRPVARNVVGFLVRGFPAACQRNAAFIWAAVLLTLVFGSGAFIATYNNTRLAGAFVDERILSSINVEDFGDHTVVTEEGDWVKPEFASYVMWNNIRVSILCFASGVFFCIPTVLLLIVNGFMVGALAGLCHAGGVGLRFWAFILPHGVIELTAIFIAAGAGLRLGYSLIAPGRHTRRDSLALAGREAILLALGVLPMLVVAGMIEGFISPEQIPDQVKLVFAGVMGTLMMVYLCRPIAQADLSRAG